jgi:hypothetical protein
MNSMSKLRTILVSLILFLSFYRSPGQTVPADEARRDRSTAECAERSGSTRLYSCRVVRRPIDCSPVSNARIECRPDRTEYDGIPNSLLQRKGSTDSNGFSSRYSFWRPHPILVGPGFGDSSPSTARKGREGSFDLVLVQQVAGKQRLAGESTTVHFPHLINCAILMVVTLN